MHPLAREHYGDEPHPAHDSPAAVSYIDSLARMNVSMAEGIDRCPEPFREIMAAMHAEILQLRRMVSEGVILGMVRNEFWKQYAQVPHTVESALKIVKRLEEDLHDREIRALLNEATAPKTEAREVA